LKEKRRGWKEDNHIKEVDQTPKTMILEGSRQGERRDGVKHDADIQWIQ
jgi:hypothetical protein